MMVNGHAIYGIFNTINCDYYIGSAVSFLNRKWVHQHHLRKKTHDSPILQNSWNKYGEDAFSFEIIEMVKDRKDLIQREQFWIDFLKPRFNCNLIAGSPLGVKHTKQSRKNMSDAHKGIVLKKGGGHKEDCQCACCRDNSGSNNPNYIEREERECACGCGGIFVCKINSKRKFFSGHNKPQLGIKRTKKHIENIRQGLLEYYKTNDPKKNKKISQFTRDNVFIQNFKSIAFAAKQYNIHQSCISANARGITKYSGNFIWRFANDK